MGGGGEGGQWTACMRGMHSPNGRPSCWLNPPLPVRSSTLGRTAKPFNPLLGETFEFVCQEKRFRWGLG